MAIEGQGAFEYVVLVAGILFVVTIAVIILRGSILSPTNNQIGRSLNTFVGVTNAEAALHPCTPVPVGLVSWWRAEGNANDAQDGNHGVLMGGAVAGAGGFVGQAFSFDGVDDFVSLPNSANLRPANITLAAWFKLNALTPGTAQRIISLDANDANLAVDASNRVEGTTWSTIYRASPGRPSRRASGILPPSRSTAQFSVST